MTGVARVVTMFFIAFDSYWNYNNNDNNICNKLEDNNNSYLSNESGLIVTGIILARAGSKGIPNKNLASLNGHPLIYWTLEAMLQSGVFQTIWVSTDDPKVKDYVNIMEKKKSRRKIYVHDRANYTATDEATSISAVQEFIMAHTEIETNVFCLVQITSPFIQSKYLKEGYKLMNTNLYDSIFTVTRQYKLRWSEINHNNNIKFSNALNFNSFSRPRRQDWSGELIENGMFYFTTKELLLRGAFQGERANYVEIPKHHSLEIDTPEDLIFANILINNKYFFNNEVAIDNKEEL